MRVEWETAELGDSDQFCERLTNAEEKTCPYRDKGGPLLDNLRTDQRSAALRKDSGCRNRSLVRSEPHERPSTRFVSRGLDDFRFPAGLRDCRHPGIQIDSVRETGSSAGEPDHGLETGCGYRRICGPGPGGCFPRSPGRNARWSTAEGPNTRLCMADASSSRRPRSTVDQSGSSIRPPSSTRGLASVGVHRCRLVLAEALEHRLPGR